MTLLSILGGEEKSYLRGYLLKSAFDSPFYCLFHVRATTIEVKQPVQWIALPAGLAKFNVDAEVAKNLVVRTVASVGRDHNGAYMGVLTIVLKGIREPATLRLLLLGML